MGAFAKPIVNRIERAFAEVLSPAQPGIIRDRCKQPFRFLRQNCAHFKPIAQSADGLGFQIDEPYFAATPALFRDDRAFADEVKVGEKAIGSATETASGVAHEPENGAIPHLCRRIAARGMEKFLKRFVAHDFGSWHLLVYGYLFQAESRVCRKMPMPMKPGKKLSANADVAVHRVE